jgi:heptose-I-phosphate ethanolaminephosphotransferase
VAALSMSAGMVYATTFVYNKTMAFNQTFPYYLYIVSTYEGTPEIASNKPELITVDENGAPTIVMIIGESFSKSHSSLYGYDKPTNPRLSMIPDSLLYVFRQVESAGNHTIESFQEMMTCGADSVAWNYRTNLVETMQCAGYKVSWISNQSEIGFFDDGVSCFAHLCDTAIWNGDKYDGATKLSLDTRDEDLIPLAESYRLDSARNMIVFHLMGSHYDFKKRYPQTFDKFKSSDYVAHPDNQRETLAQYDNSILYNDSVVNEIIKLYAEQDAIVLYFSDHALDVFESDDDYCGHAKPNNSESEFYGRQIPFMIHVSPTFLQNRGELVERIKLASEREFCISDLTHLLMQIAGVSFAELPNVNLL